MAAQELLGTEQAAVGIEEPSVHTSLQEGHSLVDRLRSMRDYAQNILQNPFVKDLLHIGARIALATAVLSPVALADQAAATFIKPTPAEASIGSNSPNPKENRDSLETASDPFTPYEFTSNAGERVKVTLVHGTGPIFPNTEISFNDTAKIEIGSNQPENLQAADQLYLNLNPNINDVIISCVQYDRGDNSLYFVDSYRERNQADQFNTPSRVRVTPWNTRSDYSTQRLMQAQLPNETPDNYIKSCKNADDNSSLDIKTSKLMLYRVFKKTGVVEILQAVFKLFLSFTAKNSN